MEQQNTISMRDMSIISLIFLFIIVYALRDDEKFSILKKDFTNPVFVISLIVILILTFICMQYGPRLEKAAQHGMIGFTIAYLAHLNMPFAVYFLIGIFVYYKGRYELIDV